MEAQAVLEKAGETGGRIFTWQNPSSSKTQDTIKWSDLSLCCAVTGRRAHSMWCTLKWSLPLESCSLFIRLAVSHCTASALLIVSCMVPLTFLEPPAPLRAVEAWPPLCRGAGFICAKAWPWLSTYITASCGESSSAVNASSFCRCGPVDGVLIFLVAAGSRPLDHSVSLWLTGGFCYRCFLQRVPLSAGRISQVMKWYFKYDVCGTKPWHQMQTSLWKVECSWTRGL